MEYNRWQAIKALGADYEAGKISKKQHDHKVAAIRKAYAEYEAQWVAKMKAQYDRNQQAMGTTGGGSSAAGIYSYKAPPQFEYVQGPAHRPGGGYTPQPQNEYVQGPAHRPGGGYTPEPQNEYVQGPANRPGGGYTPEPQQRYIQSAPHNPGGGYTQESQQKYVQNPATQPSGGYMPAPQMRYKPRSEMTPAELKALDAQTLKPHEVGVNPSDALAPNVARERERNVKYIGERGQKNLESVQEIVMAVGGPSLGPSGVLSKVKAADKFIKASKLKSAAVAGAEALADKTTDNQAQATSSEAVDNTQSSGKSWWQFWKK